MYFEHSGNLKIFLGHFQYFPGAFLTFSWGITFCWVILKIFLERFEISMERFQHFLGTFSTFSGAFSTFSWDIFLELFFYIFLELFQHFPEVFLEYFEHFSGMCWTFFWSILNIFLEHSFPETSFSCNVFGHFTVVSWYIF